MEKISLRHITRILAIIVIGFLSSTALGLAPGKGGGTESGGTSESGSGTTSSSCIGTPSAGKYGSESFSGSSGCTTEVPGTDSDGDTMLDTWEMTYSLDKNSSLDRYADGDSDGCTNACEYARAGNPATVDTDGDGIADMDDPEPNNASVSTRSLDATYKGGKTTRTNLAE